MGEPLKLALVLAVSLIAAAPASSQSKDKPKDDISAFAGVWKLSSRETTPRMSEQTPEFYFLEISTAGAEFRVERRYKYSGERNERTEIFYTDKRGEVNKYPKYNSDGFYEQKTKTVLKGGRVVIRRSYKTQGGWADVTETYSLADDGNTLVFESVDKHAWPAPWEFSRRDTFLRVL